jgi:hypothetical protein
VIERLEDRTAPAAALVLVDDINTHQIESDHREFAYINGTLFFIGRDDTTGLELGKSEGTAAGAVLV